MPTTRSGSKPTEAPQLPRRSTRNKTASTAPTPDAPLIPAPPAVAQMARNNGRAARKIPATAHKVPTTARPRPARPTIHPHAGIASEPSTRQDQALVPHPDSSTVAASIQPTPNADLGGQLHTIDQPPAPAAAVAVAYAPPVIPSVAATRSEACDDDLVVYEDVPATPVRPAPRSLPEAPTTPPVVAATSSTLAPLAAPAASAQPESRRRAGYAQPTEASRSKATPTVTPARSSKPAGTKSIRAMAPPTLPAKKRPIKDAGNNPLLDATPQDDEFMPAQLQGLKDDFRDVAIETLLEAVGIKLAQSGDGYRVWSTPVKQRPKPSTAEYNWWRAHAKLLNVAWDECCMTMEQKHPETLDCIHILSLGRPPGSTDEQWARSLAIFSKICGYKPEEGQWFNQNIPANVARMTNAYHRSFDNGKWAMLPELNELEKILEDVLQMDAADIEAGNFPHYSDVYGDKIRNYHVVPIDVDDKGNGQLYDHCILRGCSASDLPPLLAFPCKWDGCRESFNSLKEMQEHGWNVHFGGSSTEEPANVSVDSLKTTSADAPMASSDNHSSSSSTASAPGLCAECPTTSPVDEPTNETPPQARDIVTCSCGKVYERFHYPYADMRLKLWVHPYVAIFNAMLKLGADGQAKKRVPRIYWPLVVAAQKIWAEWMKVKVSETLVEDNIPRKDLEPGTPRTSVRNLAKTVVEAGMSFTPSRKTQNAVLKGVSPYKIFH